MKAVKSLSNEQVIEKGINALHRALGPTGTRQFINLARPRREDSVIHHRKWQEKLNKDEFFDKVFGSGTK
jgi:hypothetical protein